MLITVRTHHIESCLSRTPSFRCLSPSLPHRRNSDFRFCYLQYNACSIPRQSTRCEVAARGWNRRIHHCKCSLQKRRRLGRGRGVHLNGTICSPNTQARRVRLYQEKPTGRSPKTKQRLIYQVVDRIVYSRLTDIPSIPHHFPRCQVSSARGVFRPCYSSILTRGPTSSSLKPPSSPTRIVG